MMDKGKERYGSGLLGIFPRPSQQFQLATHRGVIRFLFCLFVRRLLTLKSARSCL